MGVQEPTSPAAFMSYVRFDDGHDQGFLTDFRAYLSDEVHILYGQEFEIFQDNKSIKWGENWEKRVVDTLNTATFLIPIMTPNFFRSAACRDEVETFVAREQDLGEKRLLLPLYYIRADEIEDASIRSSDEIATILYEHQYEDWRELRYKSIKTQVVRKRINLLARRITDSIRYNLAERTASPPGRTAGEGQDEREPAEASPAQQESSGLSLIGGTEASATASAKTAPRRRPARGRKPSGLNSRPVWTGLARELQQVTFQPAEQSMFAVTTAEIRSTLSRPFPAHPARAGEVSYVINQLRHALESAATADVSAEEIASYCEQAERLRKLLISLITK